MNLKSNNALGLGILIILSNLSPNSAQAEMNFQEIKGVHDLIKPEYEYLSPIYGFTLLGTKTLENMRFYGNYGPKKEGYGCLEFATRIHEELVKNKDCPQDKTSELIQRLFPSQDQGNFVANQINSDLASHLDPETLGRIASRLARVQDTELTDSNKAEVLEAELKDLLFEGLNPKGYYEQLRNSTRGRLKHLKQQGKKSPHIPQEGICTHGCHQTELDELEQKLASVDSVLKKLSSSSNDVAGAHKKGRGKDKDYKALAVLFIGALKESRSPSQLYPKNLPEQVLLSYFWKKASHKEDFLPLLKGMASHLKDPTFLNNREQLKHFLTQKYSTDDYKSANLKGDPKILIHNLLSHPEKLVFLAEQDKLESKPLPPFLSYALAKHSSLEQGTYPDCGETSVRNFFNIVLYDPSQGKFKPSILEQYKKRNPVLHFHPGLTLFYNTHTDPAASVGPSARDDWSENVVSKHEGVDYLKPREAPKCEVNAGVDNVMKLVDRLLYQSNNSGGPIFKASNRAAKIDQLCKSLSREGFQLEWELVGSHDKSKLNERNTEVELKFNINGKPSFIWEFWPGHFVVKDIGKGEESWMNRVAPIVADTLDQSKAQGAPPHSPLLLHWFANENNWEQLAQNKALPAPKEVQSLLFYSLSLNSNEVKLSSFEKILEGNYNGLYRTAQRLQDKLPENDPHTQQRLEAALADADYPQPWGDPLHAAGHPDMEYIRIPKASELLVRLGVSQERSFKTAWKDPRGLIWAGDNLMDDQGKEKALDWESAKNECFKLNPTEEIREQVKVFYESIESNPELEQLRKKYFMVRTEENKDVLIKKYSELKKNQISGCFPPSLEDILLYGRDQGYLEVEENNKFVPRFLRNIYRKSFWSGSSRPYFTDYALLFSGYDGGFVDSKCVYALPVRCVCAAAAR
jgi:hypothetical protein